MRIFHAANRLEKSLMMDYLSLKKAVLARAGITQKPSQFSSQALQSTAVTILKSEEYC
jgi:hypothetical protein